MNVSGDRRSEELVTDHIRYHFSVVPLNRTRLILRSIGLYLVVMPHLFIGLTVLFVLASLIPALMLPALHDKIKVLEDYRLYFSTLELVLVFYGLMYLFWKIKWLSDHTLSSGMRVLTVMLRKMIPIYLGGIFVFGCMIWIINTAVITTNHYLLALCVVSLLFIYPVALFLIPLSMLSQRSIFWSVYRSIRLLWGNWWYMTSVLFSVIAVTVIVLVLLQGLIFPLVSQVPISLKLYCILFLYCYIIFPYLACLILLLLENALLRKEYASLPRLGGSGTSFSFGTFLSFRKRGLKFLEEWVD
jgi:hypothetical protein